MPLPALPQYNFDLVLFFVGEGRNQIGARREATAGDFRNIFDSVWLNPGKVFGFS